jgi:epoxyqueuosine reductase
MTLADVSKAARAAHLDVMGVVHDNCPEGIASLVLLGPAARGFWPHFTASKEYRDGAANPLDRWSERVISGLAEQLGATPFFPFGGPPYQPFIGWALASGSAHLSPVGLLVHERAGLMVSYRGALGFAQSIVAPPPGQNLATLAATNPVSPPARLMPLRAMAMTWRGARRTLRATAMTAWPWAAPCAAPARSAGHGAVTLINPPST